MTTTGLSIPAQRRLLRQEIAQRKKEVLPKLRARVKQERANRKKRIRDCKTEAKKAIAKAKRQAETAKRKLGEHIQRAQKRAREAATACRVTAGTQGLDNIEKALAAVQKEREAIQDLRVKAAGMVSERGRAAGRRSAEVRAESDDRVIFNLHEDRDLIDLFRSVKHKIKGSPHRTRTEAFLEYVHDHPQKLDEIRAKKERKYEKELEKEYEERKGIKGCELELDACQQELEKLRRAEELAEQEVPF